jgi:hypothetical protein
VRPLLLLLLLLLLLAAALLANALLVTVTCQWLLPRAKLDTSSTTGRSAS